MNEIRTSAAGLRPGVMRHYAGGVRRGLALLASLALVPALTIGAVEAPAAKPRPPIAGVTLDGKRLSLADLRGKPVLINVWSSW